MSNGLRYLSVCSGIEAATAAWHDLGWIPVGFSEIEPFPCAVLKHRYPHVPNYGDMTKHEQWPIEPGSVDILVGGTPCQAFSVAGLRGGISDPRGGLTLTFLEIARRIRPRWILYENVPGLLTADNGEAFGSLLGGLEELRYSWAYRVLDAALVRTHGGRFDRAVPQRRRRVFVVGYLERDPRDRTRPAQVLFERQSLQRDSRPKPTPGTGTAPDAQASVGTGVWWDGSNCAGTLTKQNAGGGQRMPDKDNFGAVLQPLGYRWQNNRDGLQFDTATAALRSSTGSSGFHEMNHPVIVQSETALVNMQGSKSNACVATDGTAFTLNAMHGHDVHAVAFNWQNGGGYGNANDGLGITVEGTGPLQSCNRPAVATPMIVRRLTPRECERLMGFPDDFTLIPWRGKPAAQCPDGPRYKALGNSMAVNCMAWLGQRIAKVDAEIASST